MSVAARAQMLLREPHTAFNVRVGLKKVPADSERFATWRWVMMSERPLLRRNVPNASHAPRRCSTTALRREPLFFAQRNTPP